VRPRWVWGGLVIALLGVCLLGWGIAILSGAQSIAGAVLLLVGAAASVGGGIRFDGRTHLAVGEEMREVREGDVHEGIGPGDPMS
jgi:drug/metabolite transporter (DMT)-like permease